MTKKQKLITNARDFRRSMDHIRFAHPGLQRHWVYLKHLMGSMVTGAQLSNMMGLKDSSFPRMLKYAWKVEWLVKKNLCALLVVEPKKGYEHWAFGGQPLPEPYLECLRKFRRMVHRVHRQEFLEVGQVLISATTRADPSSSGSCVSVPGERTHVILLHFTMEKKEKLPDTKDLRKIARHELLHASLQEQFGTRGSADKSPRFIREAKRRGIILNKGHDDD